MKTINHRNQKTIQTVYVEYKLIKRCKELGINMSSVINQALINKLNEVRT